MITTDKLKAMAGWAMTKLHGASDAQACALHKFKDGCQALIEEPVQDSFEGRPARQGSTMRTVQRSEQPLLPAKIRIQKEEMACVEELHCKHTGQHRFDIRSQRCVWCGISYRQARGRQPELM